MTSEPFYILLMSLIDKINLTFIALTRMAIHHCLLACITGEFIMVPPELGPRGRVHGKSNRRYFNCIVIASCRDVLHHLDMDFCSSSPKAQAKKIDNMHSMIWQRIYSTCTNPAMAQPHNDHSSFHPDCLDFVLEEGVEQPKFFLFFSAAMLLLLKLACISQLFCLWVGLVSLAADSPSSAAAVAVSATTLSASPTVLVLRIWISQCKYNCERCDIASRLGLV